MHYASHKRLEIESIIDPVKYLHAPDLQNKSINLASCLYVFISNLI